MDFDDEPPRSHALSDSLPLPPDDWAGYRANASAQALYTEHRPQLSRFFRNRAAAQDIGDLVHDVFRRFLAARQSSNQPIAEPRGYLFAAARNRLADEGRMAARRMTALHSPFDEEDHPAVDPHARLEARDMLRRAEDAIARLKPLTREIFLMHRLDGLSYEQIAAAKGLSVKGVEKHMAKALVAVRRTRPGR